MNARSAGVWGHGGRRRGAPAPARAPARAPEAPGRRGERVEDAAAGSPRPGGGGKLAIGGLRSRAHVRAGLLGRLAGRTALSAGCRSGPGAAGPPADNFTGSDTGPRAEAGPPHPHSGEGQPLAGGVSQAMGVGLAVWPGRRLMQDGCGPSASATMWPAPCTGACLPVPQPVSPAG